MTDMLVLINEKSGGVANAGGDRCLAALAEALGADTFDVERVAGDPGPLIARARAATLRAAPAKIYLLAGDGTAAAIAGAIAGTNVALAPLPGGTMNAFSRDIGFDQDVFTAIGQLGDTIERKVDIAYANDRPFLNNVVFGAYSVVAQSREHFREVETIGEKIEAAAEIVGSLAHTEAERYTIVADGVGECIETNTLLVSNNCYDSGELMLPRRSRLDGGELGLYLSKSTTPIDFLNVLFNALTVSMDDSELLALTRCKRCTISAEAALIDIAIDGEAEEFPSPIVVKVLPKALLTLAPRG